jgi:hypothetical protein
LVNDKRVKKVAEGLRILTFQRLGGEVDVVGGEVVEDIGVRVDIKDVYSLNLWSL